ncbi:NUDIX hydrolase [Aquella oligotrophica]|uniref:Nudix hydrolase domain-containing protein n=1 Tax=Aquella oligotrophica TaxID=2067065 RepID=A0A2I7N6Q9_9NEIS|nr:CoA pyrophosphatase [Aquella oligotrophica]AUR52139.1 hypothetical protein CUN60_07435 [Aquella oligotrophica]
MLREPAAVLLGIIDSNIILTKRAASLKSFTGHICLPGGQSEITDNRDMVLTALREFNEEVNFSGNIEAKLCMLPECSIVSSQVVYPVVASLSGKVAGFNPDEVEKLIMLPLSNLQPEKFKVNPKYPNIKHNKLITFEEDIIWGLTAHILYKFSLYYRYLI